MDNLKLLKENLQVKAPPDFEEKVWQLYMSRKKKQKIKRLTFVLSGSVATAVAAILLVVFLIIPSREPSSAISASGSASAATSSRVTSEPSGWTRSYEGAIPITEPVLYTQEFTPVSNEKTIYILEPINDTPGHPIKY